MDWTQVVTILGVTIGCCIFFWNLSRRETERLEKICELAREDNKEFREDNKEFREDNKQFREKWAEETKDFHARLCVIAEQQLQFAKELAEIRFIKNN